MFVCHERGLQGLKTASEPNGVCGEMSFQNGKNGQTLDYNEQDLKYDPLSARRGCMA